MYENEITITDTRLDADVTRHHQQNAGCSAEFARLLKTFSSVQIAELSFFISTALF